MSSIDTAVRARLLAHAGTAALVSTRIYQPPVPQNAAYPLITFFEVDATEDLTMGSSSGLVNSRYQFDCWASTPSGARALADQVFLAFHNYAGTSDSVVIKSSLFDGKRPMPYDPDEGVFRYMLEFLIEYVRA